MIFSTNVDVDVYVAVFTFSVDPDLRFVMPRMSVVMFLKHTDVFLHSCGIPVTLGFVDVYVLLLAIRSTVFRVRIDPLFGIFPSTNLGLRNLDVGLYFNLFSRLASGCFVTLVRGREDTEGDGDTSVKIQVDGRRGLLLESWNWSEEEQVVFSQTKRLLEIGEYVDGKSEGIMFEKGRTVKDK